MTSAGVSSTTSRARIATKSITTGIVSWAICFTLAGKYQISRPWASTPFTSFQLLVSTARVPVFLAGKGDQGNPPSCTDLASISSVIKFSCQHNRTARIYYWYTHPWPTKLAGSTQDQILHDWDLALVILVIIPHNQEHISHVSKPTCLLKMPPISSLRISRVVFALCSNEQSIALCPDDWALC